MNTNLQDKSFLFARKIVRFCIDVLKKNGHFELGSQLLRSGTSVGANISEAQRAESTKDYKNKLLVALKEAEETRYWLDLIDVEIVKVDDELKYLNDELIKIIVAIAKKIN